MNAKQFLYSSELKKIFNVYGSFYNLDMDGKLLPCRNQLHIIRKDLKPKEEKPDTIVVMMNPGSSHPKDKSCSINTYRHTDKHLCMKLSNNELVDTQPDTTQYQIMRVMYECKWQYVVVINLSDIREPKSTKFYSLLKDYSETPIHSIFSEGRSYELHQLIDHRIKTNPIVVAWGKDPKLLALAEKCINFFKSVNICYAGVQAYDDFLYSHASPTLQSAKEAWLFNMLSILETYREAN